MASRRQAICERAGCGALAAPGRARCAHHAAEAEAARAARIVAGDAHRARSPHRRLYWSATWKRLRLAHLAAHPLCVACLEAGRTVPAAEVDHIEPHNGDRRLFYSGRNLQGLCASHHAEKTARERGRGLVGEAARHTGGGSNL